MSPDLLRILVIEAEAAEHGVAVRTNDPILLRSRLYPVFKSLGIKMAVKIPNLAGGDELWMKRKSS